MRVSADVHLEIGDGAVGAGREAYLFDRIMGVHRLSDGRWVVADMGSSQVRYYDPAGRHVHSAGGRGDGPREFRQIMALWPLDGDRVAVSDADWREQLLDGNGQFIGTIEHPDSRPSAERTEIAGALDDGTLVARVTSATPQVLDAPHAMRQSWHTARLQADGGGAVRLVLVEPIGEWDLLTLVPGWRGTSQLRQFERPLQSGVWSGGVVTGDPGTGELRWYDRSGAVSMTARLEFAPVPITDRHKQDRRAAYLAMGGEGGGQLPPQLVRQREQIAETWTFAEQMPAFHELRVDAADNIWLRDYVPNEETVGSWHPSPVQPTGWTVIGRDGAQRGRVELPARFAPLYFGADVIAGIHRDEFDVETVHVYRIEGR